MSDSSVIEVEVKHYAAILRQAIRAAGLSVSEVERLLGAGPKSLRRVFAGQVDLKFRHVVAVLRVIGMSQAQFFEIASRRRRRRSPSGELLASFERKRRRGRLPPRAGVTDLSIALESDEDFDRMVEDAVTRVIERRTGSGLPAPAVQQLDGIDELAYDEPVGAGVHPRPPAGPAGGRTPR